MRAITTRGRTVEIPTCLEELTPAQYERYIYLAYALGAGVITGAQFRERWFSHLVGLRCVYTLLMPEYADELRAQAEAIDGFLIEENGRYHLNFDTPLNLLPAYKGYKGPGDWLEGVTFGEFVECLIVMEEIAQSGEGRGAEESYEHIARTLYHIPAADKVPPVLTFHAPQLVASVWRAIQSEPIEINGKKIDFRIIFKGSGGSRPDDKTGWTGITFEVATAGLFGNVEQVERTDMWTVLIYLYKCKFEYLNEKRSNNK